MPELSVVLATDRTGTPLSNLLPWLILLIGLTIAGGVLIYYVRGWLKSGGGDETAGFTLHDLRQLHAAGELSDAEYERARLAMIGQLKGPVSRAGEALPPNNHETSAD